jgi:uncharacterized phosphosugar-binding protein
MKKKARTRAASELSIRTYSEVALSHLASLVARNEAVMERVADRLVKDVKAGRELLVFGSGHSSIFGMELYHRAGGPSFVLPLIADHLLPTAGPPVVRLFERTAGAATMMLDRFQGRRGEMIWLCSQSGINSAIIDLALESSRRGLFPVAFTSVTHSKAVKSRHASGKRLFEVCEETIDLGGVTGDAAIEVAPGVMGGPLSTLGAVTAAHSILTYATSRLERAGVRCVYTSVNTPEGEARNRALEERAKERDYLLR